MFFEEIYAKRKIIHEVHGRERMRNSIGNAADAGLWYNDNNYIRNYFPEKGEKMLKIAIVDDFYSDRENLLELLSSFDDLELQICGVYEDGVQALKGFDSCCPDVLVCDVEMPVMNGFEVAKAVKRDYPGVKIIFCSLYNEFEYVRKALYLDSYGYVLKPVDPDDLRQCIGKVMNQLSGESQFARENEDLKRVLYESRPVLVENLVKSLLYGLNQSTDDLWDRISFLDVNIKKGLFVLALIEIDDFEIITSTQKIEQKQIFSLKVFERVKEIIGPFTNAFLARVNDAHFVIIFNFDETVEDGVMNKVISDTSGRIVSEFRKTDISLSVAVSKHEKNILEIKNLYEQCRYILKYKYSLGKGKVLYNTDIPSSSDSLDMDFNSIQKEIRFLLNSGVSDDISQYIDNLFRKISINTGEGYLKNLCFCVAICIQIVLSENHESFKSVFNDEDLIWEKLLKFETILDAKNWVKNLCVYVNEFFSNKIRNNNRIIADEVKKYIANNYMNELSLDSIASNLLYSPNYLNYVFKTETGDTIYDFVCRYRMEKAKEMLTDPRNKLYEIAEKLGYSHAASFTNVFKKFTGLTPKEYRERCTQ